MWAPFPQVKLKWVGGPGHQTQIILIISQWNDEICKNNKNKWSQPNLLQIFMQNSNYIQGKNKSTNVS